MELLDEVEYRLVYVDQDRYHRGTSSRFSKTTASPVAASLQSSGSFETISDVDEYSFTVISRPEDIILNESWQLADGSGGPVSVSSSDQSDDDTNDEVQLPPSYMASNETKAVKIIDSSSSVDQPSNVVCPPEVVDTDVKLLPPAGESITEDEIKLEMNTNSTVTTSSPTFLHTGVITNPAASSIISAEDLRCSSKETMMSKSVVLGDEEFMTKAEIKSLQTRNRANVKKINKLSELLDIEKNNTTELLKTVTKVTTEQDKLLETIKILKCELNNVQRRLTRATKDSEEKDILISSLKTSNELLRLQLDQQMLMKRRDEQVLPRSDVLAGEERKCDIGISKPSTGITANEMKKPPTHHPRDHPPHTNRPQHRHHHHRHTRERHTDRQTTRKSPKRHELLSEFEHIPPLPANTSSTDTTSTRSSNTDYICPVCNRRMPSTLTEKQMTIHVESCLKKREA